MNSPTHRPLSKKNSPSPPELQRKTSIISNLIAKANKQPNLKKLSILTKNDNYSQLGQAPSSGMLSSSKKSANVGNIVKTSVFHQNASVQFKQFGDIFAL